MRGHPEPTLGQQLGLSSKGSHLFSLQIVLLEGGQMVVRSNFETRVVLGSNSSSSIYWL